MTSDCSEQESSRAVDFGRNLPTVIVGHSFTPAGLSFFAKIGARTRDVKSVVERGANRC